MKQKNTSECPIPTGKLIIIGGAENKSAEQPYKEIDKNILQVFVELCGKQPIIELITTAGSEAVEETYNEYATIFKSLGAKSTGHIHHNQRAAEFEEFYKRIEKANGIFLSGGDQLKLTATYGGTELMSVIKQRYIHDKLVIGGTSAGAMACPLQ